MTSIQSVLAALSIILIDLLGRAGLDKVLALTGGPAMVGLWAQLQSVVELVSAVALAGVLQGLTVLISQANNSQVERNLLRDALRLGLATSLAVALFAPLLGIMLTGGQIDGDLFWFAALAGCITVIPATLNAYWLGKHRQQRMLALSLLTSSVLLLLACGAWLGFSLRGLMTAQCIALLLIGAAIWRYMNKLHGLELAAKRDSGDIYSGYFDKLVKFVPVGLIIGIMSPASVLLVRGMLSDTLSWDEVGFIQALWRSSEWVTATAAGVLSLVFLPRLGVAYGSAQFTGEMARAATAVLFPSACLLLLIYLNQRDMLAALYDARFRVSDETAALFMLGSWVRIVSWVFLFGLFAAHRTRLIIAGEALSLPLFALLLWIFADGITLERTALLYLVSYLVYLGFTAGSLLYSVRARPPADCVGD